MDEYSPRVRATFVTQYVVAKRVSKEGGPSNILIQPPSWSPPLPGQRATIASRPHSSYGGGRERSEIAAVIYLLRSDFSSLRHPTPTFLASLLRFLLPNPPWFMTAPPPTLSGARILAAASRVETKSMLWWILAERTISIFSARAACRTRTRLSSCENFANRWTKLFPRPVNFRLRGRTRWERVWKNCGIFDRGIITKWYSRGWMGLYLDFSLEKLESWKIGQPWRIKNTKGSRWKSYLLNFQSTCLFPIHRKIVWFSNVANQFVSLLADTSRYQNASSTPIRECTHARTHTHYATLAISTSRAQAQFPMKYLIFFFFHRTVHMDSKLELIRETSHDFTSVEIY